MKNLESLISDTVKQEIFTYDFFYEKKKKLYQHNVFQGVAQDISPTCYHTMLKNITNGVTNTAGRV